MKIAKVITNAWTEQNSNHMFAFFCFFVKFCFSIFVFYFCFLFLFFLFLMYTFIIINKDSVYLEKKGAEKVISEPIDIQILTDFDVQGAKLATINHVTAYKGILKKRCRPLRQGMERNLEMTRAT